MHIPKRGQKEDIGNYRPFSLTLVLEKLKEQIILSAITQHIQDNQGSDPACPGVGKVLMFLDILDSKFEGNIPQQNQRAANTCVLPTEEHTSPAISGHREPLKGSYFLRVTVT
ncbi:hypothetical protein WISP_113073 [Willisornis vidua]|uniref:Uncharacterized protein n=1 Tax=Willisornis vidua TaxID=1566151 RepID=A0ABQ9CXP3_9PASS|nr:hypothetical protein WISP_113073 [Willisornis vidua]